MAELVKMKTIESDEEVEDFEESDDEEVKVIMLW